MSSAALSAVLPLASPIGHTQAPKVLLECTQEHRFTPGDIPPWPASNYGADRSRDNRLCISALAGLDSIRDTRYSRSDTRPAEKNRGPGYITGDVSKSRSISAMNRPIERFREPRLGDSTSEVPGIVARGLEEDRGRCGGSSMRIQGRPLGHSRMTAEAVKKRISRSMIQRARRTVSRRLPRRSERPRGKAGPETARGSLRQIVRRFVWVHVSDRRRRVVYGTAPHGGLLALVPWTKHLPKCPHHAALAERCIWTWAHFFSSPSRRNLRTSGLQGRLGPSSLPSASYGAKKIERNDVSAIMVKATPIRGL
ncbi:hypothetical protein KM043_018430 [Ampulex compressa]|nr:hypothetical protein KM043_018430 [Ampulex compressa]